MEKIIERVQKLFALAGNNPNEAEALAALEKAHALLAQHNLEMNDVELSGVEHKSSDMRRGDLRTETTMPKRYFCWIWSAVAGLHYCRCVGNRPNPRRYRTFYIVVGRRINVLVATQMSLYLCQTMRRCLSEQLRQTGHRDHAYKNAFLTAMAARLCQRVRELKDTQSSALVLWSGDEESKNDRWIEENIGSTKTRKTVVTKMDRDGLLAGKIAADGVSLNQQLGGGGRYRAGPELNPHGEWTTYPCSG